MLGANFTVHDKVLERDRAFETVLLHPRALADVSRAPPGSVSLNTETELDFSLKETTTAVKKYILTEEEISTFEMTESLSQQNPTSDIDQEHISEETRDKVCKMLTPFSAIQNGKLRQVRGNEQRKTVAEGAKPFRSQPYRAEPRA